MVLRHVGFTCLVPGMRVAQKAALKAGATKIVQPAMRHGVSKPRCGSDSPGPLALGVLTQGFSCALCLPCHPLQAAEVPDRAGGCGLHVQPCVVD